MRAHASETGAGSLLPHSSFSIPTPTQPSATSPRCLGAVRRASTVLQHFHRMLDTAGEAATARALRPPQGTSLPRSQLCAGALWPAVLLGTSKPALDAMVVTEALYNTQEDWCPLPASTCLLSSHVLTSQRPAAPAALTSSTYTCWN